MSGISVLNDDRRHRARPQSGSQRRHGYGELSGAKVELVDCVRATF